MPIKKLAHSIVQVGMDGEIDVLFIMWMRHLNEGKDQVPESKTPDLQVSRFLQEERWKLEGASQCPTRVVPLNSFEQVPETLFMQGKTLLC